MDKGTYMDPMAETFAAQDLDCSELSQRETDEDFAACQQEQSIDVQLTDAELEAELAVFQREQSARWKAQVAEDKA